MDADHTDESNADQKKRGKEVCALRRWDLDFGICYLDFEEISVYPQLTIRVIRGLSSIQLKQPYSGFKPDPGFEVTVGACCFVRDKIWRKLAERRFEIGRRRIDNVEIIG